MILSVNILRADDTYPISFSLIESYEGGKIYTSEIDSYIRTYMIKPNWADSEVLYTWEGIIRKNAEASSLGEVFINSAIPRGDDILLLWQDKGRCYTAILDTALELKAITELQSLEQSFSRLRSQWFRTVDEDLFYVLVEGELFRTRIDGGRINNSYVNSGVIDFDYGNDKISRISAVYVVRKGLSNVVYAVIDGKEKLIARTAVYDNAVIKIFGDKIYLLSSSGIGQSLLNVINENGIEFSGWIESPAERIVITDINKKILISYLTYSESRYYLNSVGIDGLKNNKEALPIEMPEMFIEPMLIKPVGEMIYIVFRNGIAGIADEEIISADYFPFSESFRDKPELSFLNGNLIAASNSGTLIFEKKEHPAWLFNRFVRNRGIYLFPGILIVFLIIFIQLYRHQKRFFKEILELPTSGILLITDKMGKLNYANNSARELLEITGAIPLKKMLDYYFVQNNLLPMKQIMEEALAEKDIIKRKVSLKINDDMKELLCTIVPVRNITGNFRGILFTGIDITEQLERKRLSNWAQLAHDMQTNLATIKLNADQLSCTDNNDNLKRRHKIIHQTNILIQRVRDIVTVGRSDKLNIEPVNSVELCNTVRFEFDDIVFPGINFDLKLESFTFHCDRAKFTRAMRNAVENGIRAIPEQNGNITISCRKDNRFFYFTIADSGKGMDEETQAKMLKPYFTTSKKHGGFGIGTMIMQQVIETHGGRIEIKSRIGKGTEIIFIIPVLGRKNKKSIETDK